MTSRTSRTKQEDSLNVPQSAAWYVKGGLERTMQYMRQEIDRADTWIKKQEQHLTDNPDISDKDSDRTMILELIAQTRGIRNYHEQWLREAHSAFETLPNELKPYNLDK
jgi:hypothetical protein